MAGALAIVGSAAAAKQESSAAGRGPPVVMHPVIVTAATKLSFGMSLEVFKNLATNKAVVLHVSRVLQDSDAEYQGIKPGDEIVEIQGRPVTDYEASFVPRSELGALFVGRRGGDAIELGIKSPGKTEIKRITVVQSRYARSHPKTTVADPVFRDWTRK